MDKLLLSGFIIAFFLISLYRLEYIPDGDNVLVSKDNGTSLRALLAVCIVFHHLYFGIKEGFILTVIYSVSPLYIAVFFFLSGYGLQKSFLSNPAYKKAFLLKRLPKILVPYIFATFAYWIMYLCFGHRYTLLRVITRFLRGRAIVANGWFIYVILIFYLVFALLMRLFGKKPKLMILGGAVYYVVWVIACRYFDTPQGMLFYAQSHLPAVGMAAAVYEKQILKLLKNKYLSLVLIMLALTTFSFFWLQDILKALSVSEHGLIYTFCFSMFSCLLVIFMLNRFRLKSPILSFLGDISLEIYLFHGLFHKMLRNDVIYIESDFLWCILVLAGAIVFSAIMHRVFNIVLSAYDRLLAKIL